MITVHNHRTNTVTRFDNLTHRTLGTRVVGPAALRGYRFTNDGRVAIDVELDGAIQCFYTDVRIDERYMLSYFDASKHVRGNVMLRLSKTGRLVNIEHK